MSRRLLIVILAVCGLIPANVSGEQLGAHGLVEAESRYLLRTSDGSLETCFNQLLRPIALRWEIHNTVGVDFERPFLLSQPTEGTLRLWLQTGNSEQFLTALRSNWKMISEGQSEPSVQVQERLVALSHENYRYDPVLATVVAGLESRSYDRDQNGPWAAVDLDLDAIHDSLQYYAQPVRGYFRHGKPSSNDFFVIINSAYSTWERGSWINKAIAALDALYEKPHLFVFPGFLTPQYLSASPLLPSLTGQEPARDLYQRLNSFINGLKRGGRVPFSLKAGIVGISGGASFAIHFLTQDHLAAGPGGHLFNRGAIAFSPILDLRTTFQVLDESSASISAKGFSANKALTTFDMLVSSFFKGYTPGNLSAFFNLLSADPDLAAQRTEFVYRFYREFHVVDLQEVIDASYQHPVDCPLSGAHNVSTHSHYYIDCVFPEHVRLFSLAPSLSFDDYTRIGSQLALITDAPLYVIFAQDDPVLSVSSLTGQRQTTTTPRTYPGGAECYGHPQQH